MQATSIRIESLAGYLTISSVYCPPRFSILKEQFEEYFCSLGDRFLACGDYNAKHTYWGSRLINTKGKQLYKALVDRKNGLDFISPRQPTYWPTDPRKIPDLLDFAISKNIPRDACITESSYDLSSDHSPIILTYFGCSVSSNTPPAYRTDWLKYKKYISSHIHTNPIIQCEGDIEERVCEFTSLLLSASDHSKKEVLARPTSLISNTEIEHLLLDKRRLRREWQQNRSPAAKQRLSQACKKLKTALHLEEDRINTEYTKSLTNTKHTNFSLWKATKNIKPPVEGDKPLRNPNGSWARSDEEKALIFANHLSSVFQPNPASNEFHITEIVNTTETNSDFLFINRGDIEVVIKEHIIVKKSPGYDKVTPAMIKNLPSVALMVLVYIFNAIIQIGFFPDCWKMSQIIMIPKPGKDLTVPSCYRPISLLPCLSKLFEKVLLQKLNIFFNSHNIIPVHQFGFREGHGTIEQVNRITGEIRKSFEQKKYCSGIFLDVAQAFDKVWHEGLIYKIKSLLPPSTHKLLEAYLINRKFRVKCNDFITNPYEIKAGVPQGSVLGPALYLIYTSDLPVADNLLTSTFADDTAILSSHKDPIMASVELSNHLRQVETWLKNWRIRVNELKSKHVTFSLRKETCPPLKLNNVTIPQSDTVTYLGIHLDRRLTWRSHINAKRLQMQLKSSELHWLIGPHSKLSLDNKVILYKSILKPIWLYGIQLYGYACNTNIEIIQRAQSKILRTITGAPWYMSNERIHRDLEIPYVKEEFNTVKERYTHKLRSHSNSLARSLAEVSVTTRLLRADRPPLT